MVLHTLLEKLPLSQGGKVFFGTALCIGICAIPLTKKTKAGHELFSSEKPRDVYDSEIQRRRANISDEDLAPK
ncbi:hypothetical protein PybrP1_010886 [[Pythium] brassicae (nom. inval.)]|nr:hypothetical protein PybrP1_010886 [[Pythium] brassicae (nom. inval.)]